MKTISQNKHIVRKTVPMVKETILLIKVGETVKFDCRELAPYSSVQSTISRLNKKLGVAAFTASSSDNGATYQVTRLA